LGHSLFKPFDNLSEDSRKINMTHGPTMFVNHNSIEIRLANAYAAQRDAF
jgi:hypothetical protein